MKEAGFIDLKVFLGSADNGDWREGSNRMILTVESKDRRRAAASRAHLRATGDVLHSVGSSFTEYIPDDQEREEFAQRAVREFKNQKHHLTFNLYVSLLNQTDDSRTVIGRKPDVVIT
jgi:hypothetical protein